jgi:hypothetical protein
MKNSRSTSCGPLDRTQKLPHGPRHPTDSPANAPEDPKKIRANKLHCATAPAGDTVFESDKGKPPPTPYPCLDTMRAKSDAFG